MSCWNWQKVKQKFVGHCFFQFFDGGQIFILKDVEVCFTMLFRKMK